MEPFEIVSDGRSVCLQVGGSKILGFLQQVFTLEDLQSPGQQPEGSIERAFVVDLKNPSRDTFIAGAMLCV